MKYEFDCLTDCRSSPRVSSFKGGLVICASWEPRSQELFRLVQGARIDRVVLIRFQNPGKSAVSADFAETVVKFFAERKIPVHPLRIQSVGKDNSYYHAAVATIFDHLVGTGCKNWLFDISSMPRRLWCGLIFLFDRTNMLRNYSFFYSRPEYVPAQEALPDLVYRYTEGEWKLESPPFSRHTFGNGLFRKNLLSVGFEYDHLKSVVSDLEGDSNSIVYANPGINERYTELATKAVHRLTRVLDIRPTDVFPLSVDDFDGVYKLGCDTLRGDGGTKFDFSFICAGTKVHTLALSFAKLVSDNVTFLIRVPRAYRENATSGTGRFDLVSVMNLHAPV